MKTVVAAVLLLFVPAVFAEAPDATGMIQSVNLNASRPYFIPTHPRVTTTIRFPKEIGAPDGSVAVFAEDAAKAGSAEYLVTWQSGDAYLTITPLREAHLANLNIPYQGQTFVFYFYPAADPLKALASVNLVETDEKPTAQTIPASAEESLKVTPVAAEVTRQAEPPPRDFIPVTPARLLGFLDRIKLVHATPPGPALAELVKAMNVQVAMSHEELAVGDKDLQGQPVKEGVMGEIHRGLNDAGLFQVILLRAVRDRRLNCIGFVCIVRNTSDQVLAFDVNSFGARSGAEYLAQRISDASPILKPGEQAPAYFIVEANRNSPLSADNEWKISVDLVSPRTNPGAAISRGFARPDRQP